MAQNESIGSNIENPQKISSILEPSLSKSSRNPTISAMRSQEVKGQTEKTKVSPLKMPSIKKEIDLEKSEAGLSKSELDPRVSLWQRDKELYDAQNKTVLHQIMVLTIQLDEAKNRISKCIFYFVNYFR